MTKIDWSKTGYSEPDPARVQRETSAVLTPDEIVLSVSPEKKDSERNKQRRLRRAKAYWEKQHSKATARIASIFAEFADFENERKALKEKRRLSARVVKPKKKRGKT